MIGKSGKERKHMKLTENRERNQKWRTEGNQKKRENKEMKEKLTEKNNNLNKESFKKKKKWKKIEWKMAYSIKKGKYKRLTMWRPEKKSSKKLSRKKWTKIFQVNKNKIKL